MEDVIDYGELVRLVEAGIESTWRQIAAATPGVKLVGYALCTDDEVCTLFEVACTAEQDSVRFSPVEWTLRAAQDDLQAASELLARRAELDGEDDHHTQSDRAFACLVDALAAVRARGLFPDDVYLSVLGTDPHPEMEAKEHASVLRLNSPAVIRAWRERRLAEARSVLATLSTIPDKTYAMLDHEQTLRETIEQLTRELADGLAPA
jgi:hypothetical protein